MLHILVVWQVKLDDKCNQRRCAGAATLNGFKTVFPEYLNMHNIAAVYTQWH